MTTLNQTKLRAMQGMADEIIKKRTSEIRGDFHDDFLAQAIREQIRVAFEEGIYSVEVSEVGYYIYDQIQQYYYDHILGQQMIYGDF